MSVQRIFALMESFLVSNNDNVSTLDVPMDEEELDMGEHDSLSDDADDVDDAENVDENDVDDAADNDGDDLESVPVRQSCEGASFSPTFFLCFWLFICWSTA